MPSAWRYLICRGLTSTTNGKYAWPMAASSTKGGGGDVKVGPVENRIVFKICIGRAPNRKKVTPAGRSRRGLWVAILQRLG